MTLSQARQGFRLRNETTNQSKKTIEWYDARLARLEQFLGPRLLSEICAEDLRQFIRSLQQRQTQYEHHPRRTPVEDPGDIAADRTQDGARNRDGCKG